MMVFAHDTGRESELRIVFAGWVEVWLHSAQRKTPHSQIKEKKQKTAANAPKTVQLKRQKHQNNS